MFRCSLLVAILILACCSLIYADDEPTFLHHETFEIGLYTGGADALNDHDRGTHFWVTGFRFGRVFTKEHGVGPFRGTLEYAIEAIPAFVIFQKPTVYGFNFSPFLMNWNFTAGKRIIPYFEWGGGLLFTSGPVPENASTFNFTPQLAFGMHFFTAKNRAATFTFKYFHISNAGLESPNPGLNTYQILAGFRWFR